MGALGMYITENKNREIMMNIVPCTISYPLDIALVIGAWEKSLAFLVLAGPHS